MLPSLRHRLAARAASSPPLRSLRSPAAPASIVPLRTSAPPAPLTSLPTPTSPSSAASLLPSAPPASLTAVRPSASASAADSEAVELEAAAPTSLSASTPSVSAADGDALELEWSDGERRVYHLLWLRDNSPADRHPSTGQKRTSAAELPRRPRLKTADVGPADELRLVWEQDGHLSRYRGRWLRAFGQPSGQGDGASSSSSSAAAAAAAAAAAVSASAPALVSVSASLSAPASVSSSIPVSGSASALGETGASALELPQMQYDELMGGGEASVWRLAASVASSGAVVVTGSPARAEVVRGLARMLGPVQQQIYGEVFDVQSVPNPINLAYSTEAIPAHMDLCYYESPPGIQLLHCVRNDPSVQGGVSFLIDGFGAALRLRRSHPDAFDALARIPATFIKDHENREHPVLMSYQRPHFALAHDGRLIGLFWSPPFEGPLRVPHSDVPVYYDAYRLFSNAIQASPTWRRTLNPGDAIVFNNRRMLHGRSEIHLPPHGHAARWLQGCYINIDEFANTYNKLHRTHAGCGSGERPHHLGNQDHSPPQTDLISLPGADA